MLYIQQAGRVLRTHESKVDAIILDHAGNTEQHGFVTDDLPQELDDGQKKKKETSVKKKEEVTICSSCAFVKPPKTLKCPLCHFTPTKTDTGIVTEKGELVEVGRKITTQDKQKMYSELLHIEVFKPYKKGFAANMYRNKFGVWPKGLKEYTLEPSSETHNFVKSRLIAYSKKRA
jgi:superfamily II DNA or RNA helicase